MISNKMLERVSNLTLNELKHHNIITPELFNEIYKKFTTPFNIDDEDSSTYYSRFEDNISHNVDELSFNIDKGVEALDNEDKDTIESIKGNISKIKSDISDLKDEIYLDRLTGSNNRKWFYTHLVNKSKFTKDGVIAFIDIIDFSTTNNLYGFELGDKVLRYLTHMFMKIDKSITIRYTGDEFIIFTEYLTKKALDNELNNIQQSLVKKVLTKDGKQLSGKGSGIKFTYGIITFEKNDNAKVMIDKIDKEVEEQQK